MVRRLERARGGGGKILGGSWSKHLCEGFRRERLGFKQENKNWERRMRSERGKRFQEEAIYLSWEKG